MDEDFLSGFIIEKESEQVIDRKMHKFYKNKYNKLLSKWRFIRPIYNRRGKVIKKLKRDKETLWEMYMDEVNRYYSIPSFIRRLFK